MLPMIILVGKSGSGKTSVAKELEKWGYDLYITDTTRPKRKGEVNGKDYYFRTQKEFDKLKDSGFYAEAVSYNANFGYCSYGSRKEYYTGNNNNKLIILNPYGLKQVNKIKNKNYKSIYLKVNDDILLERLKYRGDTAKEIKRRLKADNEDFDGIEKIVDHTIEVTKDDSIANVARKIMFII